MKKFLLILSIISMAAISCADKDGAGGATESLVTKNIPSLNKSVKEGKANTQSSVSLSVSASVSAQANTAATTDPTLVENTTQENATFTLLDRLYSTTWYQSEEDYDDGKLETNETFIFFNENSEVVEREYENGVLEGRDEYSALTWIADIVVQNGSIAQLSGDYSRNACIVKNTEMDDDRDTEYEAYYLAGENNLYVVDGKTKEDVSTKLKQLIKNIDNGSYKVNEYRYLLSVKAKK